MTNDKKCDICDRVLFAYESLKKDHIQVVHQGIKALICEKQFWRKNSLYAHNSSIHQPEAKHNCDICRQRLSLKSRFSTHIKTNHNQSLLDSNKCDKCGKTFSTKQNLNVHKKTVLEGLKNFKCKYCDKLFFLECRANKHIQNIHEKPKTRYFKCDMCHLEFFVERGLKAHKKVVHQPHETKHQCKLFEII